MNRHIIGVVLYDRGLVGEPFFYTAFLSEESLVGHCIIVPFAKDNVRALVVSQVSCSNENSSYTHLESISIVQTNLLTTEQCALLLFIAKRYHSPIHKVLRLFIPEKIWNGSYEPKREVQVHLANPGSYTLTSRMKAMLQIESLLQQGSMSRDELRSHCSSSSYAKALSLGVFEEKVGKILPLFTPQRTIKPQVLTQEQHVVYEAIKSDPLHAHLLHGITGAGKTEIYLHLALHTAKREKQSLIIVPEIVLTPQLRRYFADIFGARVSIFHSRLSEGDRLQEWCRVQSGESVVILGSRSALFAPFSNLGLIVVDEEHEWTYKNEQNPRYYVHTLATYLHSYRMTQKNPMLLVLGSATPRVETYARILAKENPLKLSTLNKKIFEQTPK